MGALPAVELDGDRLFGDLDRRIRARPDDFLHVLTVEDNDQQLCIEAPRR